MKKNFVVIAICLGLLVLSGCASEKRKYVCVNCGATATQGATTRVVTNVVDSAAVVGATQGRAVKAARYQQYVACKACRDETGSIRGCENLCLARDGSLSYDSNRRYIPPENNSWTRSSGSGSIFGNSPGVRWTDSYGY